MTGCEAELEAAMDESTRARLAAGADVLVLECGDGEEALAIKRAFPRARVVGVDRSPERVEEARAAACAAGLGGVRFVALDWDSAALLAFHVVVTRAERLAPGDAPLVARSVAPIVARGGVHVAVGGGGQRKRSAA